MPRRSIVLIAALLLLAAASGHTSSSARPRPFRLTLWAWERPEDLRFLAQAQKAATGPVRVAFLDRTLRFDDGRMRVQYRHQPLLVSADTPLLSVVRVETGGRAPEVSQAAAVAPLVVEAVHAPRTVALQIDFDARRSDRPFYAALLNSVGATLPRGIPLSITALASWCVDDRWIDTRDVDEIVPMLFQMGPDARHVLTRLEQDGRWPVDACNAVAGLATDEPHDRLPPAQSIYLFSPRPWKTDDLRKWERLE